MARACAPASNWLSRPSPYAINIAEATVAKYMAYYHASRTHLGSGKDAPQPRRTQGRDEGVVVGQMVLGGLRHRYWRQAA